MTFKEIEVSNEVESQIENILDCMYDESVEFAIMEIDDVDEYAEKEESLYDSKGFDFSYEVDFDDNTLYVTVELEFGCIEFTLPSFRQVDESIIYNEQKALTEMMMVSMAIAA